MAPSDNLEYSIIQHLFSTAQVRVMEFCLRYCQTE